MAASGKLIQCPCPNNLSIFPKLALCPGPISEMTSPPPQPLPRIQASAGSLSRPQPSMAGSPTGLFFVTQFVGICTAAIRNEYTVLVTLSIKEFTSPSLSSPCMQNNDHRSQYPSSTRQDHAHSRHLVSGEGSVLTNAAHCPNSPMVHLLNPQVQPEVKTVMNPFSR